MLQIATPNPVHIENAVRNPGGFLWWYCDLRNEHGDGLVVIWSLGLPFLPGSRGEVCAEERPAVSIAFYENGRQQLYLLQDYPAEEADIDCMVGSGRIGESTYEVLTTDSQIELRISLNEPIPQMAGKLQGDVLVRGPRIKPPPAEGDASHFWCPFTLHATGEATLRWAGREHHLAGSAYFDSNVSQVPLHRQNIAAWRWGRVSFPTYTSVYYEVEELDGLRQRFLLEQDAEGNSEMKTGRLQFSTFSEGPYGLPSPSEAFIATRENSIFVRQVAAVEDGPFYHRSLCEGKDAFGATGYGVSEVVLPENIDKAWQRPLVRMRTHRVGRSNSPFLPLFNGPRGGRAVRMIQSLLGAKVAV